MQTAAASAEHYESIEARIDAAPEQDKPYLIALELPTLMTSSHVHALELCGAMRPSTQYSMKATRPREQYVYQYCTNMHIEQASDDAAARTESED